MCCWQKKGEKVLLDEMRGKNTSSLLCGLTPPVVKFPMKPVHEYGIHCHKCTM